MTERADAGTDTATARAHLFEMATAYYVSNALYAAARLGIADRLGAATRSCAGVAAEVGADPDALLRLLRFLAAAGVVDERDRESFSLTPLGEGLRRDAEHSLADVVLQFASPWQQRSWTALEQSVRTGTPAFQATFETDVFSYLAGHPAEAALFNRAMSFFAGSTSAAVVEGYDFSRFRTVADVGGGRGALLAQLLRSTDGLRGILFDLPDVVAGVERTLAEEGLSERCRVVAGDFFQSVPSGADAYVLKSVIHDWDDGRSRTILSNCRLAMPGDGVLLLVESVQPDSVDATTGGRIVAGSDLNMLVHTGGRERTETEYRALLAESGLTLTRSIPIRPRWSGLGLSRILEAVPS
jgi:hypothetical protein